MDLITRSQKQGWDCPTRCGQFGLKRDSHRRKKRRAFGFLGNRTGWEISGYKHVSSFRKTETWPREWHRDWQGRRHHKHRRPGHSCVHCLVSSDGAACGFSGPGYLRLRFRDKATAWGQGDGTASPAGLQNRQWSQRAWFLSLKISRHLPGSAGLAWDLLPLPCFQLPPFEVGVYILCLSHHCIVEAHSLSASPVSQLEGNSASGCTVPEVSVTRIWLRRYVHGLSTWNWCWSGLRIWGLLRWGEMYMVGQK